MPSKALEWMRRANPGLILNEERGNSYLHVLEDKICTVVSQMHLWSLSIHRQKWVNSAVQGTQVSWQLEIAVKDKGNMVTWPQVDVEG